MRKLTLLVVLALIGIVGVATNLDRPARVVAVEGAGDVTRRDDGSIAISLDVGGEIVSVSIDGVPVPDELYTLEGNNDTIVLQPRFPGAPGTIQSVDVQVRMASGMLIDQSFVAGEGSALDEAGGTTEYVPGLSEGLAPGAFEAERFQRIEWARAQCGLVSAPGFDPSSPGCGGFNVDALGSWPPPVLGGGPAQAPFTSEDTQDEADHSPQFIPVFIPFVGIVMIPVLNSSMEERRAAEGLEASQESNTPALICDPCSITITGEGSWVTVTGTVDAAGVVNATGQGTVAGFPDIDVSLTGTVSGSTLEGFYRFGGEGLPGDEPLIRHVVIDLSDSGILFEIVRPWYGVAVDADGDPGTGAAPNGDDWRMLHNAATGEVLVERYEAGCDCFEPATGLAVQQVTSNGVTVEDLVVRHSPDENPVPLGVRFQVSAELVEQMGGAVSITVFTATPTPADVVSRTEPFDLPPPPREDPGDGDDGQVSTRIVELGPGFNLVGWTGATAIEEALATVDGSFSGVFVWDPLAKIFLSFNPNAPAFINDLEELILGDGLWINIDDPNGASWTQPDFTDARSVDLVPGLQIAMWTGPDAIPIEEALVGLPAAVIQILAWDVANQRFNTFNPLLPAALNSLRTLNHGDAFWIEVAQGVTWDQPAAGVG